MSRRITRTGYSSLGALAMLAGVLFAGALSVAVQLDGALWWALAAVFGVASGLMFVLAVRLLRRGRLHRPDAEAPPGPRLRRTSD